MRNLKTIQDIYNLNYGILRNPKNDFSHSKYHKALESYLPLTNFSKVLEIGAGSGEHLHFIKHNFDVYHLTDIKLPTLSEKTNTLVNQFHATGKLLRIETADAESLQYEDKVFDRVIVTCVLHHLNRPLQALTEIRRVIKPGGLVSIYLPSDPGIVYRLAQHFVSTRKLKDFLTSDEIKILRSMEHRNHVGSLENLIKSAFLNDNLSVKHFPKNLGWNLRFYSIYQIKRN